jgi:predicted acyl esterase
MFGGSYEGWTQSMAVAARPPHLAAIVPVSSITDYWNLLTFNGAPLAGGFAIWPTLATNSNNPACPELAEHTSGSESSALDVDRGPYFQDRYYLDDFSRSDVPVFVTNGTRNLRFYDADTGVEGEGHILQIEGLWKTLPPGKRRMFIGPWSHGYPAPLGMTRAEADALFRKMLSEWYGTYLKDGPAPRAFDEVTYQDDQGELHTTTSWPPPSQSRMLPLSAEALLQPGARLHVHAAEPDRASCGQLRRRPEPRKHPARRQPRRDAVRGTDVATAVGGAPR